MLSLENSPPLTVELADYKKAISKKIYDRLKSLRMENIELARRTNVTPSMVTKWLSGDHNFTIDTIYKIEKALAFNLMNVDVNYSLPCSVCNVPILIPTT
jgi:transcriptional regulator with XRE-family HTH domain